MVLGASCPTLRGVADGSCEWEHAPRSATGIGAAWPDRDIPVAAGRIARRAAALLADAGLHGHKYATDAMLGATALAAPGPVTVLTSAPEDLTALCGSQGTVIKV